MILALIPVAPIGTREAVTTHGRVVEKVYPSSECASAVRTLRVDVLGEGLRECCKRIGVRPVDLSALESGRATLSEDDWCALLGALTQKVTAP